MQTISSGTTVSVSAGSQVGSGDVVLSGGTLDVLSGGIAGGTILSGGTENVGGTEQSATVSSGGYLNVLSGGIAYDVAVSSGGTLDVAGSLTSNTTIFDGGVGDVLSGGDAQNFLVATGGTLFVEFAAARLSSSLCPAARQLSPLGASFTISPFQVARR